MEIDEIRLLEHCYRFEEFVPMYDSVCAYSEYVDAWFHRNAGVHKLADYLELIEVVRNQQFPVEIKFGLECPCTSFSDMVEYGLEIKKERGERYETKSKESDTEESFTAAYNGSPPDCAGGFCTGRNAYTE